MFNRDALLIALCEVIQLSPPKHRDAEQRYHTIGEWLGKKGSVFEHNHPIIYPQGSFTIQTTVRPHGEVQEYDLDFVMELTRGTARYEKNPRLLLNDLEARLRENGHYKHIIERKKRCIRLNYAGDFHMDILPALPDQNRGSTDKIIVPDLKLLEYKPSNPKGYQNWFKERARYVFHKDSSVEPLASSQAAVEKTNLCNIVQLAKRARDVRFENPETSVRSIVLTTLLARHYIPRTSLLQELLYTLNTINNMIASISSGVIEVYNPANQDEKLSECWDDYPEQYTAFASWMNDFHSEVDRLQYLQGPALASALKSIFGEHVINQAIELDAQKTEELRASGKLGTTTKGKRTGSLGIASSITPAIKKNTFYGDE